jgi:hypothetical protein
MKTIFLTILLGLVTAIVHSQDIQDMLKQAASSAIAIKKVDSQITSVKDDADAFIIRRKNHDANPCKYPEGHPEVCDAYNKEAADLDLEGQGLLKNLNELEDEIRTLKWQHQLLLAKIRIQKVFTGDKCGCSKKIFSSLENEVYCYQICWDNR